LTSLYHAKYLLPISSPPIENGALLVREGRILAVGDLKTLQKATPEAKRIDFGDGVLLPPLVNAHTHLELTHYPSWSRQTGRDQGPEDFVGWAERLIDIKRQQDQDALRRSLQDGLRQSLLAGTGAVGDILSQHHLAAAYSGTPLLGRVYLEVLGVDPVFVEQRLQSIERHLEALPGGTRRGVSPHSPYTLSREMLDRVLNFSDLRRLPVSIHLAESQAETDFFREGTGAISERLYPYVGWKNHRPVARRLSPVAYLNRMKGLNPNTLVVHGVQVDAEDVGLLARAGATVVICPRSNAKLGVGLPPVKLYCQSGIPLALGTDSLASCDSLSVWDELRFAWENFSALLEPSELLCSATRHGAAALGLAGELGCLEKDRVAHFQVVELPAAPALEELAEALCAAGSLGRVRQLYLNGKQVLSED